jgi:ABC-2 type transport system ATP-binding protein
MATIVPALEIRNLNKYLDGKQILSNVSITVQSGEIYSFLGPNGAGKTTTMKCILNLIEKDSGTIRIFGEEGLPNSTKKILGFMPENTYLYKYLTGREFLRFNGRFFYHDDAALETKIDTLLQKVGLSQSADKILAKYSKGMLQRIGLAQSIINDPKIVFLDEPMSGLDPIGRKMVKDLILELKHTGTTIFFNTHILSDVENFCDHFAIIHRGRIVAEDAVANLKKSLEEVFIEKISEHECIQDMEVR